MRVVALPIVLLLACSDALPAQGAPPGASVTGPAQETPPDSQPLHRTPATARIFGTIVPGAGHIYAGEYINGVKYYYGTVGGIGGGALWIAVSGLSANKGPAWPLQVGGVVMIGVGIGVWVRSALDAPRAAARANAKHSQAAARVSMVLRSSQNAARTTDLGMSVAW